MHVFSIHVKSSFQHNVSAISTLPIKIFEKSDVLGNENYFCLINNPGYACRYYANYNVRFFRPIKLKQNLSNGLFISHLQTMYIYNVYINAALGKMF